MQQQVSLDEAKFDQEGNSGACTSQLGEGGGATSENERCMGQRDACAGAERTNEEVAVSRTFCSIITKHQSMTIITPSTEWIQG